MNLRRYSGGSVSTGVAKLLSLFAIALACDSCRKESAAVTGSQPSATNEQRSNATVREAPSPPSLDDLTSAAQRVLHPRKDGEGTAEIFKLFEQARAKEIGEFLDTLDLDDPANRSIVATAFLALARKDSAMFLKYASQLDPTSFLLRGPFLAPLLSTNRKAVVDWLIQDPHESGASRVILSDLCLQLAGSDPATVFLILEKGGDIPQRQKLESEAYLSWGRQDFRAALAHARSAGDPDELEAHLKDILRGAGEAHPQEALATLSAEGLSPGLCEALFAGWLATDSRQDALTAMASLPVPALRQILLAHSDDASAFAALSPTSAKDALAGMSLDADSVAVFKAVAKGLLNQDPAAANAWGLSQSDGNAKRDLISALYSQWIQASPDDAKAAMLQLSDAGLKDAAIAGFANSKVQAGTQAAVDFSSSLPAEFQGAYTSAALKALQQTAGPGAAAWMARDPGLTAEAIASPEFQDQLRSTSQALVADSLPLAKEWLGRLDGARLPAAVEGFTTGWLKSDAASAIDWIQSSPPGEARDAAVKSLVAQLANSDPQKAKLWQSEIGKR